MNFRYYTNEELAAMVGEYFLYYTVGGNPRLGKLQAYGRGYCVGNLYAHSVELCHVPAK